MVLLQRQNVIAMLFYNLAGYFLLCAHRIDCDRAFPDAEHVQQPRDLGDLVVLFAYIQLTQHQLQVAGKSGHDVLCLIPAASTSTDRLAVDTDVPR